MSQSAAPQPESAADAGPTSVDTAALLADRYGRAPKPSRKPLIFVIVFVVVGTFFLAWTTVENARGSVEWKDVGFDVVSSEQVDVTFDVTMEPGMTATCTLDALNTGYAQVGTRTVNVGPNDARTTRYTATIATSEEATTGLVQVCDAS
ncbi:protein of unknown function [Paraoerskovia marina]|uniref:DUF4307 domain-containing protein n=1 Tax=Paraoerskovia marina TaxID=545619 RepID=A0A1H1QM83_9CELL|nr:DUF4307 domain-containing protein [Paraoerskovia marina]SDS24515.1 protein of unknown function [Paraoerskovia marina]